MQCTQRARPSKQSTVIERYPHRLTLVAHAVLSCGSLDFISRSGSYAPTGMMAGKEKESTSQPNYGCTDAQLPTGRVTVTEFHAAATYC